MEFIEYIANKVARWRYHPIALPLLFVGLLLGIFYVPLPEGVSFSLREKFYVGLPTSLLATVFLWLYQRPPKAKKGHKGIIVAVSAEDERIRQRISKDFVSSCRKILSTSNVKNPFQIIELNEYLASQATDFESANGLRKRCNGSLLIFGEACQRKERGKVLYVFKLNGLVLHRPTSKKNQAILSHEMGTVLPLKHEIQEDNELSGFEVTSLQLAEATKYVIATAALLSGEYRYAISLLEELLNSRAALQRNANVKAISQLIRMTPIRLADAYKYGSFVMFNQWQQTRSNADLLESVELIEKYTQLMPKDEIHMLLLKAIKHFVISKNIEAAFGCINQCKAKFITDPNWKYSAAFLEAYRNNLNKSMQYYSSAKSTETGFEMPFQIEDFIAWILENEPDKKQLYFNLGYINEKLKMDAVSARKYYLEFIGAQVPSLNSQFAIQHAEKFLGGGS